MKYSVFFVNILINTGIMALFLTIFFFTIAQYFEKQIVENQIDFVINDFVGNTFKPVSDTTKNNIKNKINKAFAELDFTKQDKNIQEQNKSIKNKAWAFVAIILSIIAVIVIILGFIYKWEPYYIKYLFNSAFIGLIFVAITEFLFMFLIAQNFLSADPNKIKCS